MKDYLTIDLNHNYLHVKYSSEIIPPVCTHKLHTQTCTK